mmetsp:Transcript_22331/g.38325  ORF Transcript_22331/g.38325 Transcript_22331/m.38325 type:complete len:249 (+) Transcript_22331:586-1332(+)
MSRFFKTIACRMKVASDGQSWKSGSAYVKIIVQFLVNNIFWHSLCNNDDGFKCASDTVQTETVLDPFCIHIRGSYITDVTFPGHSIKTKKCDIILSKVEKLRVGIIFAFYHRLATPREAKGGRKACAELIKWRCCLCSKKLPPQLPIGICVGVDVIPLALIPIIVSRNNQKVGCIAEQVSPRRKGIRVAALVFSYICPFNEISSVHDKCSLSFVNFGVQIGDNFSFNTVIVWPFVSACVVSWQILESA